QVPTRLVSSAKSWLCHAGGDRKAPILPWKAPEGGRKVSPLEASTRYLKHLAESWNARIAKDVAAHRLEQQDIILTVPASFDAVARELTVEAARAAGLENLTLLEEPQAAFYSWIEASHEEWRKQVEVGDVVLVCDIGGGTLKEEGNRADVEKVLIEGFFPECPPDARPKRQRAVGLQELGLPYAADPAITKHLAEFVSRNAEVLAERAPSNRRKKKINQ